MSHAAARPTLPGRRIYTGPEVLRTTAARLIECYRFLQANPTGTIYVEYGTVWTKSEFLAWFHRCLNNKINREDRRAWRKLTDEYQLDLWRDAREINRYMGQRVRHTGCSGLLRTAEMRQRYPHINRQAGD